MDYSKRLLMYETNSKTDYVDYGEIVSIINNKLVNINMGGQRDTNGQLVILEAVAIEGNYVPQVSDWVGVEWRSGVPIAIGGSQLGNSAGLKNINDNVVIVSQQDMANGVINTDHIRTDTIEARHIKAGTIQAQHISAGSIQAGHISANAITAINIQANAIEAQHIKAGSIQATHITANAISASQIQANAINTNHLSANSITSAKIAADAIQANHISANAIVSKHISANLIQAQHISAGAINATHISANTIQSQHISANSIQSQHITAGAIQAGHLAAGSITAGNIAAGSISGGNIIGDTIESKHLTVSTREFGLLAQYFTHSGGVDRFEVFKGTRIEPVIDYDWGSGSPSVVGQNDNFSIRFQGMIFAPEAGTYTFYITADNGAKLWLNDAVVVDAWVSGTGTGTIALTRDTWSIIRLDYWEGVLNAKLKLEWKTPSGVRELIPSRYLTSTQTVIDGGTILTNTITASNIKVGTITAASGIIADASIGTAHIISGNIVSAHIANASIKSAHIASANILSAHIASANINNAHISDLNAGKINAGFISSDRIAAGSISGNHIAANTINGDRIIGNTIDANKIKAGSITALQIGANTITATEIMAGSISGDKIRAQSITAEHISARGIDVANNIMIYNSTTGETLIGGGYLRVDGLDVGVVQSDNLLANGLFLTASSAYGLLKNNIAGETMLGAKNNEIGAHQVWKYDLATGTYISAINIEGKKPMSIAIDETDTFAYVTVQGDNTLAQIDIANDYVTTNVLTMGTGPAEIKYFGIGLQDHKHFFALNTDTHDHMIPDTLMVIDAPPMSINGDLYLHHVIPVGNSPYDMVMDANKRLYVTQAKQGDIAVLDMSVGDSTKWKIMDIISIAATGTDNYHGGLPSTVGFGFVVGGDAAGAYDATGAGSSMGSAHVHGGYGSSTGSAKNYEPRGIAQSADIDTLYVVDTANNELVIVDKKGNAPYNKVTGRDTSSANMGGHEGHDMPMPPVTGGGSPADSRGNLMEGGGPRTSWVRYRIPIGEKPERVEIMNGKVFVTLQGTGQLAIINEQDILTQIALDRAFYTPSWTAYDEMREVPAFAVRTVTVGSRPTKILANPAANTLIISLTGQDKVVYFNAATETVIRTINAGSNPTGLAMTNDGRYLYVVNNGGGGDLSFIYPKGPYIGDPFVGLEGVTEYQGASNWTPYRTDWVKDASGNIIASASVEFRINEPFLNEGGYAKIALTGKLFQEAWIEQDIYNVENYSNGNNVVETIGEKMYNISGNQATWYAQTDWLLTPLPTFKQVSEASGNVLIKNPISPSAYTLGENPTRIIMNTPIPSGNWIEASYTSKNNIWYKPHNGSVLIALENSSTANFKTEFHLEEFVPKFVVFDNQQTTPFTPTADGINEEYLGIEYSVMTNRAKGKTVTASATPTAGSLALVSDGLQVDDMYGDHTGMTMFPNEPFVTLPAGLQHVKVDLGDTYMIGKVTVAHSYEQDRVYQGTKTEVSEDGITWTTVYDSAVSGLYSEKPSYHALHGHTHYSKVITFPARPVRYIRDWANGYKVGGVGSLITANHWTDIKAYGDWQFEKNYVYDSGATAGQQIATNGKGIVTTDISKAFIAIDVQIEFTSWWYMTYVIGPEFGTLAIEMPTIMNSNHILDLSNKYINKIAHRHIMSFPPSNMVEANEGAGIKAGKHRAIIRQESGKISIDRFRFEDFQFYKTNPLGISKATTSFRRYSIVAQQAKWYEGKGKQSTFGPYDTPRTNPDTGLPDKSVPIKYRFRVKSFLNAAGTVEERGISYITSAIVETGKQSTHWRPSAASDLIASSKLENWDGNQPHKTGIQSHHLANGAVRGPKILPKAIMDYHISPYAKIEEFKINLKFPTHPHANKLILDSLEGFGGSGGNFGTSNKFARFDHDHPYLGVSGTAINATKLNNLTSSQFLRSDTTGTLTGGLTITQTLNVTGNTILRGTLGVTGSTSLGALTATSISVGLNPVWHSGNFLPSNYFTKTETNDLLNAAGDIRAGQANTFKYAGLAVKIQPSANVATGTKLFQINNSVGSEMASINNEGALAVKSLKVEGSIEYQGTTVVQGDYTIQGGLNVSGNSVLNTLTVNTITIPAGGAIKQLGKEVEVMRFPVFGISDDMQFETDSTTFDEVIAHYWTFDVTGKSCLPPVPTGATRKYRLLVSYSTNTSNTGTLQIVQNATTTVVATMTLPSVIGSVEKMTRTFLSPAFVTNHFNHTTFQAKSDTAGTIVIRYIEVIAYDVY